MSRSFVPVFIMLTEFVVLLGKGRGGLSPIWLICGYVLLNRVWFSGSSVINSFTIIVMSAKQNARNLLFTVLVWDSEPIRLLESPRLLSVNILNMKKLFECSQVHATRKYNWLVYNKSALCRSASPEKEKLIFLSPRRVSPFLAWGDFLERSRFARSTIPEEKWGTTRSLPRVGPCLSLLPLFDSL